MMRRDVTSKFRRPKRDKKRSHYGKKKGSAVSGGQLKEAVPPVSEGAAPADEFAEVVASTSAQSLSGANEESDESYDFVFKRPRTPPPKIVKKESPNVVTNRRIRSKSKPGKTGFPIGASLHGLSKLEKQERRNRAKSRSGSSPSSDESILPDIDQTDSPEKAGSSLADKDSPIGRGSVGFDHVISHPRKAITKLRFPSPKRGREANQEKPGSKKSHHSPESSVKESIEICQGVSKIKLDDWHPFFDFYKNLESKDCATSSVTVVENGEMLENGDDDEWEESLVYVDLEDIPDVNSLFTSLRSGRPETVDGSESAPLEMQIFNLDSDLPVLLLGGKYLAGNWEDACGTSLFFKKRDQVEHESEEDPVLKNILPEPEIPYDPIFGLNQDAQTDDDYELVAKSMKILKARYFPVVNDELKGEDVIRDPDEEFDQRDFQIPPINMVREFLPDCANYEEYLEQDLERRKKIQEKWGKKGKLQNTEPEPDTNNIVKTEPIEYNYGSDTEDLDNVLILDSFDSEPTPGTSTE